VLQETPDVSRLHELPFGCTLIIKLMWDNFDISQHFSSYFPFALIQTRNMCNLCSDEAAVSSLHHVQFECSCCVWDLASFSTEFLETHRCGHVSGTWVLACAHVTTITLHARSRKLWTGINCFKNTVPADSESCFRTLQLTTKLGHAGLFLTNGAAMLVNAEIGQCTGSSVSILTRLRAGRPRFDSQVVQWRDVFLFATASRPVVGPTQPPTQWVPRALSHRGKAAGAWYWPLTSVKCRGEKWEESYLHYPISLRGEVLNYRNDTSSWRGT
jgi:hypothetical protein